MHKPVLVVFLQLLIVFVSAQCDGTRFREFTFADTDVTENITYGNNIKYDGSSLDLLMDVYQPSGDAMESRPLVILAHGGLFLFGSKDGPDVIILAADLARMGYVTACVNYRLGLAANGNLEASMTESVMRGVQDVKAAVRWFRANAEGANDYHIDPNQIYVAGVSAGGYIALHLAYLDQESEIPTYINFENPGLSGGLEGESGSPGYSSDVRGIINLCGAIGDTAWIHPGDEPALLFHGDEDATVPFGSDMQYLLGSVPVIEVDGSNSINERLNELEITHCFEVHEGFDHVPHVSNSAIYDTTLSKMSNFLSHLVCDVPLDCEYRELAVNVEEEELVSLDFYPNPSEGFVRFASRVEFVEVRSLTGQLIGRFKNVDELDLSGWASGVYILSGEWNSGRFREKLIIQ
jgi:para-nitrobenzyl esterase